MQAVSHSQTIFYFSHLPFNSLLQSMRQIRPLLAIPFLLFSYLFSFAQTDQSFEFNFRDDLFRIHDFSATINEEDHGNNLLISALNESGEKDLRIAGDYVFIINRVDTVSLHFMSGQAFLPIDKIEASYLIRYVIFEAGENKGFKKVQYSKSHLFAFHAQDGTYTASRIPQWLSLLPPLVAILMALLLKEVVFSLFGGIWIGSFILYGFRPLYFFRSLFDVIDTHIIRALSDTGHLSVVIFSLLIGGMVAIISRNGGMAGIVQRLSKYANSARNAQLITWLMGIAIFFDDYANTLIVGNTMRPVTDRYRVSREKLAYLVDSTAAPVAAIAFVTTWIGAELGYIGTQATSLGIHESAYSIFFHSLQYAFYPILTLVFIYLLIRMKRDFGGMYHAEIRSRKSGNLYETHHADLGDTPVDNSLKALNPVPGISYRWQNAFYPILTVILLTIGGLAFTGYDSTVWYSDKGFFQKLSETIGAADSYRALLWASLSGVIVAVSLSAISRALSFRNSIEAMVDGFKTMMPAIIILVLAWSLASVTESLHTAEFLSSALGGAVHPLLLPLIIFLLASLISFSTGSSWSTMAILYPIALPTTWVLSQQAGLSTDTSMHLMYNVTAVVLAGSVFGDHCSPISDTTVMSSLASSCNHIDHVSTQLPYALTVGLVSMLVGTLFIYVGLPWYLNFVVAFGLLYLIIRLIGKTVPDFTIESVDQNG